MRFEGMPTTQSDSPLSGSQARRAFLQRASTLVRGVPSEALKAALELPRGGAPVPAGEVRRTYARVPGPWRAAELIAGGSADALVRISSDAPLDGARLDELFAKVTARGEQTWRLDSCVPQPEYARYELAPRLVWAASGECMAPTLEGAAIAARNAAKMVRDGLRMLTDQSRAPKPNASDSTTRGGVEAEL